MSNAPTIHPGSLQYAVNVIKRSLVAATRDELFKDDAFKEAWEREAIARLRASYKAHMERTPSIPFAGSVYHENIKKMSEQQFMTAQRMAAMCFVQVRVIPHAHFVWTQHAENFIDFSAL